MKNYPCSEVALEVSHKRFSRQNIYSQENNCKWQIDNKNINFNYNGGDNNIFPPNKTKSQESALDPRLNNQLLTLEEITETGKYLHKNNDNNNKKKNASKWIIMERAWRNNICNNNKKWVNQEIFSKPKWYVPWHKCVYTPDNSQLDRWHRKTWWVSGMEKI